jgi:hypothetical protein
VQVERGFGNIRQVMQMKPAENGALPGSLSTREARHDLVSLQDRAGSVTASIA